MAYRNGVYVAFNGCGTTNPTESDIKYFNLLKAWAKNKNIEFNFSDSNEKTSSVKDTSKEETLKKRLQERMRNSKNILIIITENSSQNRGLLNWEIDQCNKNYDLPFIIAYTMTDKRINNISYYKKYLPEKLRELIDENKVKSIHIPFKKEPILESIESYNPNNKPSYTVTVYKDSKYDTWGID